MVRETIYFLIFLILFVVLGFRLQNKPSVRYLPLGDSYTICTGASKEEAWPTLLTSQLNEKGINCVLMDNPARNGYSTQDLIDYELPLLKKYKPEFVTLLIGVNDWVRGVTEDDFQKNYKYILDEVQKNISKKENILLITIPNFGVTPNGKNYSRGRDIGKGISEFNSFIKSEGKERNLSVVDIFEISEKMGVDASVVAKDGLHPSAKEYAVWETMILPKAMELLIK
jgi:acyl-CoA thioesterase I